MKRVIKELNQLLEFNYYVEDYYRDPYSYEEVVADVYGPFIDEDEAYDQMVTQIDDSFLMELSF